MVSTNLKSIPLIVQEALEDLKATEIQVINVKKLTSITDYMIIATGNSTRHVKAIARNVDEQIKKHGFITLGIEGEQEGEWILLDINDVVVHIMLAKTREFYSLEKLWSTQGQSSRTPTSSIHI